MAILFYDHLVNKNHALIIIDELDVHETQKTKLKKLVDDILHQGILEYVLQKLHPHQHQRFLRVVTDSPYDPLIMEFLRQHLGEDIDQELQTVGDRIISEILEDLKHQS